MRALHQGAARRGDAVADDRAGADRRAGRGRRAAGIEDLSSAGPVGLVLAGGGSRRLGGTPKGLEEVGGVRIIDRVLGALRGAANEILLAANDPSARNWLAGVAVVPDIHPGAGGLAGVHAALAQVPGRDALVVAWDMPFVTTPLLHALIAAARQHGGDVVLPESDSPYGFEPFCALYASRTLEPLSAFLRSGGGAARDFLRGLGGQRVHVVPIDAISRVGDPARLLLSVNTPEDLERARAIAKAAE